MNGRQPSVRAAEPKQARGGEQVRGAAQGASLAELARQGGMKALGVLSEDGRTRSEPAGVSTGVEVDRARAVTMSKAQARQRRAELAAELAALEQLGSSPGGPSDSSSSPARMQPRIYHPRAVSAGHPASLSAGGSTPPFRGPRSHSPASGSPAPRDPVATRIERSFVGGYDFEEVSRDEVGDYPAVRAEAMRPPPEGRRQSAGGSWWSWGRREEVEAEEGVEGKKEA